jgi:hypothetical protein
MIYPSTAKGPFKVAGFHDRDSKRIIGIIYKPATWVTGTVYYRRSDDDYDIVLPTVFKGLYFKANNPGLSGSTEPVWPTTVGATVTDGGIVWEAVAYNLMTPTTTISTSTFTASDGVTLISPSNTAGTTQVTISAVPAGVASFTITNHTVKSTAEEEDVTLLIKVTDR